MKEVVCLRSCQQSCILMDCSCWKVLLDVHGFVALENKKQATF